MEPGTNPTPSLALDPLDRVIAAIDAEPEFPGEPPAEMIAAIMSSRDTAINAMRIAVRQTKDGIRKRVRALASSPPQAGPDETWICAYCQTNMLAVTEGMKCGNPLCVSRSHERPAAPQADALRAPDGQA